MEHPRRKIVLTCGTFEVFAINYIKTTQNDNEIPRLETIVEL